MDEIRRQIENLMGEIEAPMEKKNLHDEDVCKPYLCGLCPHELFENTKLYMGPCRNIHSEVLRERYLNERSNMKNYNYRYERESLRILQGMVDDCNKKIERNRVRAQISDSAKLEDESIKSLDLEIKEIMKEIDELGASGDIDGSLKRMEDLTRLNQQKIKIIATKEDIANGMYRQKLHPCEVCAAFLSETDNDQRLNDHFCGKIHMGYLKIRKQAKDLKEFLDKNANKNDENNYGNRGRTGNRNYFHRRNYPYERRQKNYKENKEQKEVSIQPPKNSDGSQVQTYDERRRIRSIPHHCNNNSNQYTSEQLIQRRNYNTDSLSPGEYVESEDCEESKNSVEKHKKTRRLHRRNSSLPPSDGEISPESSSESSRSLSRSISPC
ncbi:hypothetical protein FG386_000339 [Cryptosporidium ryanae]|uniref:uncharacterized protein n=1 Tax=Cryptosporidium ryanae TaxID=515981 RepID=UPI00351A80D7|nr:hypothetical protein FG386_000339 [Cryptosporidium ryanae]